MSAAKGSFPYRHRTVAEAFALRGGGRSPVLQPFDQVQAGPPSTPAPPAAARAGVEAEAVAVSPRIPAASAPSAATGPERHIALRDAARAHLKACGFFVQRKSLIDPVPEWSVSHFNGWFSDHELIQLAGEYGLKLEAVA